MKMGTFILEKQVHNDYALTASCLRIHCLRAFLRGLNGPLFPIRYPSHLSCSPLHSLGFPDPIQLGLPATGTNHASVGGHHAGPPTVALHS